ncbi:MAG: aminoacyl-tRNA hydrolase [Acholeplasmatales bacterium]|jgi:aminoacyl-tRNA hydrolase|nr:aminoacyl-tRNA hydrolase [Acholeplasmatales bacterium]MDD7395207.1 aminoacyl-tRNA hydrolase [Acholeplasmatales bacterium]MDY4016257.1 aminoacyl-tRNA hydrolase [Bacilli bacterium]HCX08058.1 aminoacyl-tRNA hydrolase [Acholeplasmatales bacterium]
MVIVGLGNIGKEYENTHHNAGFMAIDQVAKANNLTFLLEKKFQAYICEYFFEGKKNYLVKPITYMNNSGIAVKAIMDYYNLSEKELVVIYDDLDLPLGQIRIRESGSAGTHNGMKSIVNMLGTKNFARIRIGIAKQKEVDTIDYVLSKFSKKEMETVNESLIKFPNMIDDLLKNGITYIMNHYNGSDK